MASRSVIGKRALRDDDRPKAVVGQKAGMNSAEGVTATAGLLRVGVVDRETGTLKAILVVKRRAGEELSAGRIDDNRDTEFGVHNVLRILL